MLIEITHLGAGQMVHDGLVTLLGSLQGLGQNVFLSPDPSNPLLCRWTLLMFWLLMNEYQIGASI